MITAVDANVILDILTGQPEDITTADRALEAAKDAGEITISAVGYAEVAARFKSKAKADDFFALVNCAIQPVDEAAGFLAGQFFREYKKRGGKRNRVLADFLIGAHAQLNADRILTRDNSFFSGVFPRLKAVRPSDLL